MTEADERIIQLEAEVRTLRGTLAMIGGMSGAALAGLPDSTEDDVDQSVRDRVVGL